MENMFESVRHDPSFSHEPDNYFHHIYLHNNLRISSTENTDILSNEEIRLKNRNCLIAFSVITAIIISSAISILM